MASDPKIKPIGTQCILGEGPHWDAETQSLYYVDIIGHKFYKYTPADGKISSCKFPQGTVSFVIPVEGSTNKFLVSYNRKVVIAKWDGVSSEPSDIEEICEVDADTPTNQLNDGKCDPFGRLYAGTMAQLKKLEDLETEKGAFYLFDLKNRTTKQLATKISISNGLAWDLNKNKMYYIDSLALGVYQYDYDPKTGNVSNKEMIIDYKKCGYSGMPDGMCIDNQGHLWIASFNAGRVIRIDPTTNRLLQTVIIPARQATSVAFGGPNLDTLYITSASMDHEKDNAKAGYLYEVTRLGDVKGVAGVRVKY